MTMSEEDNIELREIDESDLELLRRWRNDPSISRWFFSETRISRRMQREWYARYRTNDAEILFMICRDGETLGTIGLCDIVRRHRKAQLGRFLIADPGHRNRGFGKKAVLRLLEYAFCAQGLNRVYLEVFESNAAAVRAYQACGFEVEGELMQSIHKGGAYYDTLLMAILKQDYERSRSGDASTRKRRDRRRRALAGTVTALILFSLV